MKLKDRLLLLVATVLIAVSLFTGLVVIVDNVNAAPLRPAAAVSTSVAVMSEHIEMGV